jgi:glutathione synthase/RimK-type ligase-like ATP-grasp enzyme
LLQKGLPLRDWFARHKALFLKPTRGSRGKGILHLQKLSEEQYRLISGEKVDLLTREELRRLLGGLLRDPYKKYLVQQALPLLDINNRKVDIRIVLHRDSDKEWQPIATVPRLGGTGRIITNIEQGGEAQTLEWLNQEAKRMHIGLPTQHEIEKVAVEAARAMTQVRPKLAFLGIDIAPDIHGNLWLLDINPRPGRKVLQEENRKFAFSCLTGYAKTLLRERETLM